MSDKGSSKTSKKKIHYTAISKQLKQHNITWDQYKKNPLLLANKSIGYRNWLLSHFKNPLTDITWFNKEVDLTDLYNDLPKEEQTIFYRNLSPTWQKFLSKKHC